MKLPAQRLKEPAMAEQTGERRKDRKGGRQRVPADSGLQFE